MTASDRIFSFFVLRRSEFVILQYGSFPRPRTGRLVRPARSAPSPGSTHAATQPAGPGMDARRLRFARRLPIGVVQPPRQQTARRQRWACQHRLLRTMVACRNVRARRGPASLRPPLSGAAAGKGLSARPRKSRAGNARRGHDSRVGDARSENIALRADVSADPRHAVRAARTVAAATGLSDYASDQPPADLRGRVAHRTLDQRRRLDAGRAGGAVSVSGPCGRLSSGPGILSLR